MGDEMTNWPADKIERRKVADLIPYARNARTHSDEQVAQIAASINEWGWTTPVLIDDTGRHHRRTWPGYGCTQARHRRSAYHDGYKMNQKEYSDG
jgi:hypothetical protein